MKMRLKPLRGQTYYMLDNRPITFLRRVYGGAHVLDTGQECLVKIEHIQLPIIDTKDYEKIEDAKYKGD
jgi:hypothetical protein